MSEAWFGWNWKENYVKQNPEYARIIWQQYEDLFHKMLPEVVTDNSPETFYWPSSPFSRYDGVSENNKGIRIIGLYGMQKADLRI